MDTNTRYELKAEAFRLSTGMLAPGKDAPAANPGKPFEERMTAWLEWQQRHNDSFNLFCMAADRVLSPT